MAKRYLTDNTAGFTPESSSIHVRPFLPVGGVKGYEGGVWPLKLYTDYILSGPAELIESSYRAMEIEMARRAAASRAWARRVNGSSHVVVPNAGAAPYELSRGGVSARLFLAKLRYSRVSGVQPAEELLVFPGQRRILFILEHTKYVPQSRELDENPLRQRVRDIARETGFGFTSVSRMADKTPELFPEAEAA